MDLSIYGQWTRTGPVSVTTKHGRWTPVGWSTADGLNFTRITPTTGAFGQSAYSLFEVTSLVSGTTEEFGLCRFRIRIGPMQLNTSNQVDLLFTLPDDVELYFEESNAPPYGVVEEHLELATVFYGGSLDQQVISMNLQYVDPTQVTGLSALGTSRRPVVIFNRLNQEVWPTSANTVIYATPFVTTR